VWRKLQDCVEPIDYGNVPGCTCYPEIASVGLTEKQAKEKDTNKNCKFAPASEKRFWYSRRFCKSNFTQNTVNG
jgi:pyruvate/2-oxoglutarate dehydrogenase complex dihydrolipoamide dehydrogenase (E3) component